MQPQQISNRWIILKFGGSSVGEVKHWKNIATIVEAKLKQGYKPLLVLSALKNVSNLLEGLLHQSLAGVHSPAINHLKELHQGFTSQLNLNAELILQPWFDKLEKTCLSIYKEKQISPLRHAQVLSIGELLSTSIGTQYLKKYFLDKPDINTKWLDAREMLISSEQKDPWHHFTSAECQFEHDHQLINKLFQSNTIFVTQGFIAADKAMNTVLLGREGSDTSAAYFGAKLNAEQIEIWTDVPGIFSANPREIPEAIQLPRLNYQQAHSLSQSGAKVLHPRAIEPAEKFSIPIQIRSTALPQEAGTEINKLASQNNNVLAIILAPEVSWLRIQKQTAKNTIHIIESLESYGFDLIFQQQEKNSTHIILVYNNSDSAHPDKKALKSIIENTLNNAANIEITTQLSLISVVGEITMNNFIHSANSLCESAGVIKIINNQHDKAMCVLTQKSSGNLISKELHRIYIEQQTSRESTLGWLSFSKKGNALEKK